MICRRSGFPFGMFLVLSFLVGGSGVVGCRSNAGSSAGRGVSRSAGVGDRSVHASAERIYRDISVLAHDSMTGRGIGTSGIDLAAGYIAGQFAAMGVMPGAADGSYFQEFEVDREPMLTDDYEFVLTGVEHETKREVDYKPFAFSSDEAFSGDVVFVGYGIVNKDQQHDDYADVDVEGKVVLMLRREPPDWPGGGMRSRYASFRNKVYEAKEHGAAAVLIVNRVEEDSDDRFAPFFGRGTYGLPAIQVTRSLAEAMLAAGEAPSLAELQDKVDKDEFASVRLSGVHLSGKAGVKRKKVTVRNVVGVVPGDGPLADEYVVIGGHYDHLGNTTPMGMFGRSLGASREIHNGADDNASGTAGVIEAGRLLMRSRPLRRSVLLIAFTAEESGLLGSRHFVDQPTVPLAHIVAMLNMDMIGRLDPDKNALQVFGTKAALEFEDMVPRIVARSGFELRADKSALGPSDHTSFYQKKIPSVHVFTGLHEDYHRPGDDTEKINADGAARAVDVVVAMARKIAERDTPPTYFEVKARANLGNRTAPRVAMGIMPGYVDSDEKGMRVEGVLEGGPAAKAGMKDEDRIVRIGSSEVNNIEDYMGALRNNKPGDQVDVVVRRGEKELTLHVKLTGR